MKPSRINYPYKGTPKMVCKVFYIEDITTTWQTTIALHEAGVGQEHILFDSPGGVDVVVAQYLYSQGVNQWHHFVKPEGPLYVAPLWRIISAGIEKTWGGRDRYYLPKAQWTFHARRWYSVPWIKREMTVTPEDLPARVIPEPEPEQQSLFGETA